MRLGAALGVRMEQQQKNKWIDRHGTDAAQRTHRHGTDAAQTLHRIYIDAVQNTCRHSTEDTQIHHRKYIDTAQKSIDTARQIHRHNTENAGHGTEDIQTHHRTDRRYIDAS